MDVLENYRRPIRECVEALDAAGQVLSHKSGGWRERALSSHLDSDTLRAQQSVALGTAPL